MKLQGALVAIVTPFRNGAFDEDKYRELIDFQIENGTTAIVPVGTTGESATLSFEEHRKVIKCCVEAVSKRVPVIAGTGANSTAEAVELTKHAKEVGADASLQVCPYYNKPTQEGMYRHFKTVVEQAKLPIILYNVPGRTGINLLPDTVARLGELSEVVAIKEASGSITQITEVVMKAADKLTVLSGDDTMIVPTLAVGGKGVISVLSNVAPRMVSDVCENWLKGDVETARKQFLHLFPLCNAMFIENNPIAVKTALGIMGMISDEMRLPMCPMGEDNKKKLRSILETYGLV